MQGADSADVAATTDVDTSHANMGEGPADLSNRASDPLGTVRKDESVAGECQHKHLFSAENQPRKRRGKANTTQYIKDAKLRRRALTTHLKAIKRTFEKLESVTGASLVCIVQYPGQNTPENTNGNLANTKSSADPDANITIIGSDSRLKSAVYSHPRSTRVRHTILAGDVDEDDGGDHVHDDTQIRPVDTPVAASPGTNRCISAELARSQLHTALGRRPGYGKEPRPRWWPPNVQWHKKYPLWRMRASDVLAVHAAFGAFVQEHCPLPMK